MTIKESESLYFKMIGISDNFFQIKEILHSQLSLLEQLTFELSSKLEIENVSAILLSILADYSKPYDKIPIDDIVGLVRMDHCKMNLLPKSLKELVDKNYLKINKSKNSKKITYSLTEDFLKQFARDLEK